MTQVRWSSLVALLLAVTAPLNAAAQEDSEAAVEADTVSADSVNACVTCHANAELMVGEFKRLYVTEHDLANDIHWQKGLRCNDCHGGDANEVDFRKAHFKDSGFRSVKSPADIPGFCGHCHSNPEYMRQFSPSPRCDQEAIYWTSGHGQRLKVR